MPFLKYRDNDSGLQPSSYPYILGRASSHYKMKPTVFICIIHSRKCSLVMADDCQASRNVLAKTQIKYMECKCHAICLIYLDLQVYIDG